MNIKDWLKKRAVLVYIIIAVLLLEVISAVRYHYTRGVLEQELEKSALIDLIASALRIQEILSKAEVTASSQMWHVKRHLADPDYMGEVISNMVKDDHDNIIGAAMAFKPHYYPEKGNLFELYARQEGDSICLTQIGSEEKHDYTKSPFYQLAMKGDTTKWTLPYWDAEGAHDNVTTYALPIKDQGGEPVGFLAVDLDTDWIDEVVNIHHRYPSSFSMVLSGTGELIVGPADSLASASLVQQIVAMINDSTVVKEEKANGRVTGFAFTDKQGEPGHVYYAIKRKAPRWRMVLVCYDDEVFGQLNQMRRYIGVLLLAAVSVLGFIIQLFVKNNRRLMDTRMQQERIESELRIAHNIQRQMLPRENSILRNDITVFGSQEPAREVGGDLYDFFLRDEKLFFCIGDVSGKGVPSAMLMAVTHSFFRAVPSHENNPARMMQAINRTSCNGNDSNMFVTLFIGVLDLPTGRLRYCNAGHDKPILIAESESQRLVETLPAKANLPVGVFDDVKYDMQEQVVKPGTTILLYTDGLTEAKNRGRKQFGLNRLHELLQSSDSADSPHALLQTLSQAVKQFAEGADQSDDLTMLAIRYSPEAELDILNQALTLNSDVHQVDLLGDFVKNVATQLRLPSKMAGNVRLAVEEAVVNVMTYAYPAGEEGEITVQAKSDGHWLKFVISDSGQPFDPTEARQADTSLSAEDRPIGGLGIHIVRKLMDSINYERIDGKNILTLRKEVVTETKS